MIASDPRSRRRRTIRLAIVVSLQGALVAFVLLAPIGFDIPSGWGLDYGHFLLLAAAYVFVFAWCVVDASLGRRWGWISFQGIVAALGLAFLR